MENQKNTDEVNKQVESVDRQSNKNGNLYRITVCGGDGCTSFGGQLVRKTIEDEIKANGYEERIELNEMGCRSLCFSGPIIIAGPRNKIYKDVNAGNVPDIIKDAIKV